MTKAVMLLALVAMVQGDRVNQAVSAHSEAQSQGEVIVSVHAKFAFANENRSGCTFVGLDEKKVGTDEKEVPGAQRGDLSDADFAALEADPNIVAYAYGPGFDGRGQILAWSYLGADCSTGSPQYLWAFYPKSPKHTESKCANDRLKVTPSGDCKNTPYHSGVSMATLEAIFRTVGEKINLDGIVEATLVDRRSAGLGFRLAGADGKVMDKSIFVCSFSVRNGADAAIGNYRSQ